MFKKYKNQDLDMTFWWKKNPKTPSDYVKLLLEQLSKINTASTVDNKKKLQEECFNYLIAIKMYIMGEADPKPTPELIEEMYKEMHNLDLFYEILHHFSDLEFEARKEVVLIFSICLNYSKDNKFVTVDFLVSKPRTITYMLRFMETTLQDRTLPQDVFLLVGTMVIECIKYEQLNRLILKDTQLWKFFQFATINNFEISTESLQILNSALSDHPKLVSREFFCSETNVTKFIQNINKLIAHGSYVTKRQSTKLLASLILRRANNQLMQSYINSPDNLKLIMTVMTDKSKNLQLEAFNVFKVMVANPRKTKPVFDILTKNRDKLLMYFEKFGADISDRSFQDEREFIIQQIDSLPRLMSNSNNDNSSNPSLPNASSSSSPIRNA
ncbi:hypothetical protein MOSE0_M11232 [Monosporozyma servazzii]